MVVGIIIVYDIYIRRKRVFDMNDFKSIQELLNEICSCIAVDESGKSFIRTKAGTGGSIDLTQDTNPTPDPETLDADIL